MILQRTGFPIAIDALHNFGHYQIAKSGVASPYDTFEQIRLRGLGVVKEIEHTLVSMITGTMSSGSRGVKIASPIDFASE